MSENNKMTFIKAADFKPTESNIKIADIRPNKKGQGMSAYFSYKDQKNLYITTDKHRIPFDVSFGMKGKDRYMEKANLVISYDDQSPEGTSYKESMEELQDILVKHAHANCMKWFGDPEMTEREVRRLMYPLVKIPTKKDPETGVKKVLDGLSPTYRVTLNTRNDKETNQVIGFSTEIYDYSQKPAKGSGESWKSLTGFEECKNLLRGNSQVRTIMTANSIWVTPTGFGINWRARQIVVYSSDPFPKGECHIDDDEEDSSEGGDAPAAAESAPAPAASSSSRPSRPKLSLRKD